WNATRRNYRWVRGWKSSLCNFVTSDKLITDGYGMEMLIDDDTENIVAANASILLEDGWSVKVAEISSGSVAKIEVYDTGNLKGTFYIEAGEDLIYNHTVKGVTLPIIVVHVTEVFYGPELSFIQEKGIVQISDYYMSLT
ncbi:MAG: S-layer protein domain-containing protein, partial [Candidatus Dojkabacteria bacterium]